MNRPPSDESPPRPNSLRPLTGGHDSNRGYAAQWQRVGPLLESIRREETRRQGSRPNGWRNVDSLLQLGYLHGNRNPPTGLIEWQARLAAAFAKRAQS